MRHVIRASSQLGQLLQGSRKSRELSQTELGAYIGISQKRQSALERAPERITVEQLLRLLAALDLELVVQNRKPANVLSAKEW